jgi:5'-3' exonuclease
MPTSTTTGPSGSQAEPALLFDARSLFDRGYYASLTSEELAYLPGHKAAACAALMVLLPLLGDDHRLDQAYRRALFCWDGARKTAKPRRPKPPDFYPALDYFQRLLPTLVGGAHATPPDHEGDDAVATAAMRVTVAGGWCCVVSGDKDLQQLVNRHVAYYCLNRRSLLSSRFIMDHYGLTHPSQLAVWLAVVGDPGDGIAGVRGWGKVRMRKLLAAAPPGETLGQLVERVAVTIPDAEVGAFYQALEHTLLNLDVPDIPAPGPLVLAPVELLKDEGLDHVLTPYAR